jgi:hypothetical protein
LPHTKNEILTRYFSITVSYRRFGQKNFNADRTINILQQNILSTFLNFLVVWVAQWMRAPSNYILEHNKPCHKFPVIYLNTWTYYSKISKIKKYIFIGNSKFNQRTLLRYTKILTWKAWRGPASQISQIASFERGKGRKRNEGKGRQKKKAIADQNPRGKWKGSSKSGQHT